MKVSSASRPDDGRAAAVPRVAEARGLDVDTVLDLAVEHTEGRDLAVLGEPGVNVVTLNLALDAAS